MLKTQQISQPDSFGPNLLTAKNSNSSNKLSSSKRRAANARQQSIGGQLRESVEAGLLKLSGDIKLRNVDQVSEDRSEQQMAPTERPLNGVSSSQSDGDDDELAVSNNCNNKRKQSALAGQQLGRRRLASVLKHSDISEERMSVTSSDGDGRGDAGDSESKAATGGAAGGVKKREISSDTTKLEQSDKLLVGAEEDVGATLKEPFKVELVWTNIVLFIILHSCLPIGFYLLYAQRPWLTLAYSILGMYASGLGVTGGTHRLWSHRSYKASWPVQFLLMALQTMAGQNSIYTWSRDHRVHHKFSETDADPHNIKRGFFFAHMGWLCCKKHPDVKEKGKLIDMSDLEANPLVMFQHRHFWWLAILFTVLVPTMIPVILWGERFWTSFTFSFMVRYLITLHSTWLVNSAAHYYGTRPYDAKIEARESPYVIYNGLGEGFHNYHHTFPYDYATSEFGQYFNITTAFIDLCAALGLAKDRRKVDRETIMKRRLRTGELDAAAAAIAEIEESQNASKEPAEAHHQTNGLVRVNKQLANGHVDSNNLQMAACRKTTIQKTIDELEESGLVERSERSNPLAPLSNIIHELPYISGLTSMKYTM